MKLELHRQPEPFRGPLRPGDLVMIDNEFAVVLVTHRDCLTVAVGNGTIQDVTPEDGVLVPMSVGGHSPANFGEWMKEAPSWLRTPRSQPGSN